MLTVKKKNVSPLYSRDRKLTDDGGPSVKGGFLSVFNRSVTI